MRKNLKTRNQHIILMTCIVLLSVFTHSLRDIPKYYKNMAYVGSFNAIYYLLCRRHLVWDFAPNGIHWLVIRFIYTLIITPLIVLIFLSKMPRERVRQVSYIIRWTIIASIVEYVAHKKKLILYSHGWNIYWSGLIYVKMFVCSHLFSKRPLITLALSTVSTAFYILKFKVPILVNHRSKYFEPLVDFYYHTFLEDIFGDKKRKRRKLRY
ncbi:CBO0543 family protein [Aquibacillus sediminis]|uniref:CBO0543 family protein n=1 Tax=Aquibacillus sediminis TaxID=2574734 RepID=UPI001108B50E|nr:CBO0543 family protein [Aquibacillus sediminis]